MSWFSDLFQAIARLFGGGKLSTPWTAVAFYIRDTNGKGISSAEVQLNLPGAAAFFKANEHGNVLPDDHKDELYGVKPGTYYAAVRAPGYVNQYVERLEVTAGENRFEYTLKAGSGQETPPPATDHPDPLVGHLVRMGRSYKDKTGPRTVYFCSFFPALRILRDNPKDFHAELDRIAAAGWLGFRTFWAVGGYTFWNGREVAPVTWTRKDGVVVKAWPNYKDLLRGLIRACRERHLRLHLTAGDLQYVFSNNPGLELEWFKRIASVIRDENAEALIGVFELANEAWQNTREGHRFHERAQTLLAALRPILPNTPFAISASPGSELDIDTWSRGADVVAVHGTRQPWPMAIRRAFNLAYEGQKFVDHRPLWQGEPTGPDGSHPNEVYRPTQNKHILFALYCVHLMTGQASVYFNGPAIRYREPLNRAWGFKELPPLFRKHVPEDIGQWPTLIHGRRDEAPLTAPSWHVDGRGNGPERIDQATNGRQVFAVVSGGDGDWNVTPRRGMRYQVLNANGIEDEGTLSAGDRFPRLRAELKARVIRGWFV